MAYVFNRDAVRKLREGLGYSLREFGEKLGISHQTVMKMEDENGDSKPNVRTLERIMEVFSATPMAFFVHKDPG